MSPRLVILDLDGTVYRGAEPVPGSPEAIAKLRERGVEVRFLTNNSGQTRESIADKLTALGVPTDAAEVTTSGDGAAARCLELGMIRVFVVGESGLVSTLSRAGLRVVESGSDAVIAGICRTFGYDRLSAAMREIRAGAAFVATNRDATYPVEAGRLEPGAGAIVAAIEACAGVSPEVIGKPNPYLVELILAKTKTKPEEAVVVGDRPNTDLEAGRSAGCRTMLVLTGVTAEPPPGTPFAGDLAEYAESLGEA